MRRFAASLAALTLALASAPLRAQGLVQLSLQGEVATSGGALVEVGITFIVKGEPRNLELSLHLAERTTAADLAGLVRRSLDGGGGRALWTSEHSTDVRRANLFIEDVQALSLRLGHGLTAAVTLCEEAPAAVRVKPPLETKGGANLAITASTLHPHNKDHGRVSVELDIKERWSVSDVADALTTASIAKGWAAQCFEHETWRPEAMNDGSRVTGTSIELRSAAADWRLEVELIARRRER